MAVTYASPGVYVEEVDRGPKPIEILGASIAAFVGITAEASLKALDPATGARVPVQSVLNKATLVTNWTQFTDTFGGFTPGAYLPDAVYGYFANGGGPCYVTSLRALDSTDAKVAAAMVDVPAAKGKSFSVTAKTAGAAGNNLTVTIKNDVDKDGKPTGLFSMSVGGESKSGLSMKKGDGDAYLGSNEFTNVDVSDIGAVTAGPEDGSYNLAGGGTAPLTPKEFVGDPTERTGLGGLEALDDVRLVLCPDLMAGYDGSDAAKKRVKMVQEAMITHCELMRYRFAVLDAPPGLNAQQAKEWRLFVNFDTSYAAMYYPWIQIADLSGSGSTTKMVPPSGHMVGVYNRTDGERGVHKAPANEIVRGAIDLELVLSRGEQDTLNPIGVNCIRTFPGRGIRVWGARTLSSDGSWRYINVRRLFIVVESSIDVGMQWVVFEPNDHKLWSRVRRDTNAFLTNIWRSGALFGLTPSDAFYVKCDEELNPAEVRDLGQLIIEIGISPVKPAEFVIFRISQWAGPNSEG
ncbi:MAG TPA: phage tail sheath subtilisin-like domain-containing protein [candidate division Zixibacteria bacterium]|nr:phage tail sheath subtilisin-like domain-containing protein [candidate division Zixibacteria bacterium]